MRKHPRFLVSKSAPGSKSEGVFIIHTISPRFIVPVVPVAGTTKVNPADIVFWEPAEEKHREEAIKALISWAVTHSKFITSFL